MNESKEVAVYQPREVSAFGSLAAFEGAQRMAQALASSDLVPKEYRGKVANCLVALEVAQRCQASPLMVMQNLNIVHGKPSWSSAYIIAAINSCGKFAPLRFKMDGAGDDRSCVAWTTDKEGEILEGPPVSIKMAKAEGWFSRKSQSGAETSKWPTMPELMLRYRAAAFFGRLYAPEILMGMRSDDEEREIIDLGKAEVVDETPKAAVSTVDEINQKIRQRKPKTAAPENTPLPAAASETPAVDTPAAVLGDSHF